MVLIDRGSEVGGGDSRSDVGVVAKMLQVAAMDGGRFALVTVGTRRIRIVQWLRDDWCVDVEEWPTARRGVAERIASTAARARRCGGLAVEMGDQSNVPEGDLTGDPSFDSFLLTAISPLGPADQHAALVRRILSRDST